MSLFIAKLNLEIFTTLNNFINLINLIAFDPLSTSEFICSNINPNGKVDKKSIQNHDAKYALAITFLSYVIISSSISIPILKLIKMSRPNMIVNGKSSIFVNKESLNTMSYGDYTQMNNNISVIKLTHDN